MSDSRHDDNRSSGGGRKREIMTRKVIPLSEEALKAWETKIPGSKNAEKTHNVLAHWAINPGVVRPGAYNTKKMFARKFPLTETSFELFTDHVGEEAYHDFMSAAILHYEACHE